MRAALPLLLLPLLRVGVYVGGELFLLVERMAAVAAAAASRVVFRVGVTKGDVDVVVDVGAIKGDCGAAVLERVVTAALGESGDEIMGAGDAADVEEVVLAMVFGATVTGTGTCMTEWLGDGVGVGDVGEGYTGIVYKRLTSMKCRWSVERWLEREKT